MPPCVTGTIWASKSRCAFSFCLSCRRLSGQKLRSVGVRLADLLTRGALLRWGLPSRTVEGDRFCTHRSQLLLATHAVVCERPSVSSCVHSHHDCASLLRRLRTSGPSVRSTVCCAPVFMEPYPSGDLSSPLPLVSLHGDPCLRHCPEVPIAFTHLQVSVTTAPVYRQCSWCCTMITGRVSGVQ
jgi:hypothetical protein